MLAATTPCNVMLFYRMRWLCCGRNDVVEPEVSAARVLDNPQLRRFITGEFAEQNSAGSLDSNESRLTTMRRQSLLEVHKRRLRIRELQNLIYNERVLIDDLILELAIT